MRKIEMCVIMVILIALAWGVCGCHESQRWGQGDPPAAFQDLFGNENNARLNFVQSQVIDRQGTIIYGINTKGPDGRPVRKRGLIERVAVLEALEERVEALEAENPAELAERVRKLEIEEAVDITKGSSDASPDLPYIYDDPLPRDPNMIIFSGPMDLVCTKHGRLNYGEHWIFTDTGKSYCQRCVYDVWGIYLDKHIGVDPNTALDFVD